jgi:ribosomal protein S21|tara:strand:- start:237 stop:443 length:207 start_codon:yes stop_codon:yes gene_type:complete
LTKITVIVKQGGPAGALESHRALRRKLQREGYFKLIKQQEFFEKPSDRKRRKRKEALKAAKRSKSRRY